MEPQMQEQGDPIAEAIQRRAGGGQSPDMSGGQAPQMPQEQPAMPPMGQSPDAKGVEDFMPTDSHELVLATLAEELRNNHKLEMERLKLGAPAMA